MRSNETLMLFDIKNIKRSPVCVDWSTSKNGVCGLELMNLDVIEDLIHQKEATLKFSLCMC